MPYAIMNNWAAQALQFVWFTPQAQNCDVGAAFTKAFGAEPDQTQRNKHVTPMAPFFGMASIDRDGMSRRVSTQPGRVDIVIHAAEPSDLTAPKLPVIPDWLRLYGEIRGRLPEVCKCLDEVIRVAFVATLLEPTDSLAAASASVGARIGLGEAILTDASDLNFQINRLRSFSFDESMTMNRLLRFSTVQAQVMTFFVSPTGGGQPIEAMHSTVGRPVDLGFGAQLLIDLNTVPSPKPFSSDTQAAILEELCAESDRIREIGSIQALVN